MPMTPHKGESQSDFMKRCMSETFTGDREQEQAVAICMDYWRSAHGGKKPPAKDYADTGYRSDGKKRFALDTTDQVRIAWLTVHGNVAEGYTLAQLDRICTRIIAAWKAKIDPSGPPPVSDATAMLALRQVVIAQAKQYAPDPDPDESHEDFLDRCVDELTDDRDMDEDDATEACQLAWDENNDDEERGAGNVMHKTHATEASGMDFVLSDATPDRFGDIVEPGGWETESFQKNPIALFNHDKNFIVGRWKNLRAGADALIGELQLAPKGTSPRIDEIRKLVEADILRAVSVGFRPIDQEPINPKDLWAGTRYKKHELVETSLVAVPANPNALAVAKSLNISPTTVRLVFGEDADKNTVRRNFARGEDADKKRDSVKEKTGEHAEPKRAEMKGKPMLLSQRITEAEKRQLALQDSLDKHLETIDDAAPTEEQMALTEDFTAKIEAATRHISSLKAIEAKNAASAADAGDITHAKGGNGKLDLTKAPPGIILHPKKVEPLDYMFRAAVVRCKSKSEGTDIDTMRRKIYGEDEATRVVCDYILKAASAPAETTVTGWAAELVRTIWADWMAVLLPFSVFPKLSAAGLALTFGANGRIIIPTRNLTPSVSGSFVAEGAPIPVRQGMFASQTLTPKKMAVITTYTREMSDYSIPAIEGLLRQAVLEDTAIALDNVLLDANPATTIRPPGLRSYQAGLTASAAGAGFPNFVADYKTLFDSLITLTNGNVRRPVLIVNPAQALAISLMQPPAAAAPLFPFIQMIDGGRVLRAELIESSNQPIGQVTMVDAADFTTAGVDGPRMEISDQATLHFEDTTPADIVSGPSGTPVPATPVKSLWQTDSLGLRLIHMVNWVMRRPVVAWIAAVTW